MEKPGVSYSSFQLDFRKTETVNMVSCCVHGCLNRHSVNEGLKFYRIPSGSHPFQINRRKLWLQAIKRKDWAEETIKNARICGAHFISGQASLDSTNPDFVPSVFSYTNRSRPGAKLERKRKGDGTKIGPLKCAPATATASALPACSEDLFSGEEEAMVPKTEYDNLHMRHSQLQKDHINLRRDYSQVREENLILKEKLRSLGVKFCACYTTCSVHVPDFRL